jgi:ATPases involved in chromosome partitioning
VISLALFNNKGGVGKTTLTYHLAHMMQRQGRRVLAVDLDPQSNLTAAFLDEDALGDLWGEPQTPAWGGPHQSPLWSQIDDRAGTVASAVKPIMDGLGDVRDVLPVEIRDGLWLVAGDLDLSAFEDRLSDAWPRCFTGDNLAAIRTTTAFYRIIVEAVRTTEAEIVLIDVGPNLGAINRAGAARCGRRPDATGRRPVLAARVDEPGAGAAPLADDVAGDRAAAHAGAGHRPATGCHGSARIRDHAADDAARPAGACLPALAGADPYRLRQGGTGHVG